MPTMQARFILRCSSKLLEVERFSLQNWGFSREYHLELILYNPSCSLDVTDAVCLQVDDYYFHGYIASLSESISDQIREVTVVVVSPLMYFLNVIQTRTYSKQPLQSVLKTLLTNAGLIEGVHFELNFKLTEKVSFIQDNESTLHCLQALLFTHGLVYRYQQNQEGAICLFSDSIASFVSDDSLSLSLDQLLRMDGEQKIASAALRHTLCTFQLTNRQYQSDTAQVTDSLAFSTHNYAIGHRAGHQSSSRYAQAQILKDDEQSCALQIHQPFIVAQPGEAISIKDDCLSYNRFYVKSISIQAIQEYARGSNKLNETKIDVCMSLTPYLSGLPDISTKALHFNVFHTANINETKGPYPELTEDGKYQIKLHIDEHMTHTARNALYFGGNNYGYSFPLDKKTEVLVAYENGNSDQPVILGALPNKINQSVVRKDNDEASIIRTKSANSMQIVTREKDCYFELCNENAENRLSLIQGEQTHAFVLNSQQGSVTIDAMRGVDLTSSDFYQLSQSDQSVWANRCIQINSKAGNILFNSLTTATLYGKENIQCYANNISFIAAEQINLKTATLHVYSSHALNFKSRNANTWKIAQGRIQLKATKRMKIKQGNSMIVVSPTHIAMQTASMLKLNAMTITGL